HPNIVQYTGFLKTKDHLNIIMEYCENGSLSNICKKFGRFPEHLVAVYIAQVLDGLLYLHDQGVIHRDIKGANILTTKNGQVKLADFGIASKVDSSNKAVVGSPYWMAPEVIELSGATTASDIWSVGCTTIELIAGHPPYYDLAPMSALFRIVQDDHPPIPEGASTMLTDFLVECFQKDCNLRVSAKKLLRHPWIQNARKKIAGPTGAVDSKGGERGGERATSAKEKREDVVKPVKRNWSGSVEEVAVVAFSAPTKPIDHTRVELFSESDDTNWENDFDDNTPWELSEKEVKHASSKEVKHAGSTSPVPAIPAFSKRVDVPTSEKRPASSAPVAIEEGLSDVWDEDFEMSDTDVTVTIKVPAANTAVTELHGAKLDIQGNVPTAPIAGTAKMAFSTPAEKDISPESDEDDPFLNVMEDDDDADTSDIVAKDKNARLNSLVMDLIAKLRPGLDPQVLIGTCDELVHVFKEHPELRRNLITHHCVMPIVEMLETSQDHNVIVRILRVINQSIENNLELQENLCLLGGMPVIMGFTNRKFHLDVRKETACFVRQMCRTSTLTLQMFISCRGLPVLVDLLDEDYSPRRELIWMAVDGISSVFELQGPTPKNDFCRLFAKHNLLPRLAFTLHCVNCDRDPVAADITAKIVDILLLFSQADAPVKEALASRACIKGGLANHLEKAHLIEELCELLGLKDSPFFRDIQNQVLNTLYNLCRINKSRQEAAALAGLVPQLQQFVKINSPLKQFALPLLCEMAHAGKTCREVLWACDTLESYLSLLTDAYWQVNALEAIFVWLSDDPVRIGTVLATPSHIETLATTFCTAKPAMFETILTGFQKILAVSSHVCAALAPRSAAAAGTGNAGNSLFMQKVCEKLTHPKAGVRLNLLRILSSICDAVSGEVKDGMVERFGLNDLAEELATNDSAILVREMAKKLRGQL
ncbi:hypothetical protein HK104_004338, partial [Borealophlyctis nickersoniae]